MFGGFGGDSVWRRVCRVYSFDFDTNEFKIFHEPKGLETSPPPRSVHSVCLYNDLIYMYLLIFISEQVDMEDGTLENASMIYGV